ncbi:MAG: ABC transporter substrate-binding protein [Candidatus Rokubacteria bacterium]|nr:ABC transporter substrate-binding protein [Candidatus Rokubacteria bacterium]
MDDGRRSVCVALVTAVLVSLAPGSSSAQGNAIVIGAHLPLTGANADPAARMQRGYQLLVDDVNARGGIKGRPLQLVIEDDRNDPTTVRAAIDRLGTRDKAVGILGTYGSANGMAGAQQAERYGIPNIQPFTSNPKIVQSGHRFVFNLTAGDDERWNTILNYLLPASRAKRIAGVSIEGIHTASFSALKDAVAKAGGTVVAEEAIASKQFDMAALATRLKERKPDLLIYNATTAQSIQIHRSLKQLNVNIPWVARSPSFGLDTDLVAALGKDLDFVVGLDEWYLGMQSAGNADFERSFQARHKYAPTRMEAKAYATAQLMVRAIEQAAEMTPQAVRDTLLKGKIQTIIGEMAFKENGQRHPQNLVGQLQGGKVVILWPAAAKLGEPKPAPDWTAR